MGRRFVVALLGAGCSSAPNLGGGAVDDAGVRDDGAVREASVRDAAGPVDDASIRADGPVDDAGTGADVSIQDSGASSSDAGVDGGALSYSTNFPLAESPISENGAWHHTDPYQTVVTTLGGFATGTQTGSGGYDDSTAFLSGFPADQRITAVIHKGTITGSFKEVELLLRWSEGATRSTTYGNTNSYGYEINLAYDGSYWNIGRFKGPALLSGQNVGPIQDGDTFEADIAGDTITVRLRGSVIGSATDTTGAPYATGNPGIGFFVQGATGDFGFKSITAQAP
jgi:hypothetical protein